MKILLKSDAKASHEFPRRFNFSGLNQIKVANLSTCKEIPYLHPSLITANMFLINVHLRQLCYCYSTVVLKLFKNFDFTVPKDFFLLLMVLYF